MAEEGAAVHIFRIYFDSSPEVSPLVVMKPALTLLPGGGVSFVTFDMQ